MNAVIYVSKGGNTKKLAEAIAKGAGVKAQSIAGAADMAPVDILFIGASIYAGGITRGLRQFLRALREKQAAKAVVFGTSASGKSALAQLQPILESKGIPVFPEEFYRKGSFLCVNRGCPNAGDLAEAEAFAKRVCGQ